MLKNKKNIEKEKLENLVKKVDNVIKKIVIARTKQGLSYDNMAHELSITPAAYRKIETGETRLTLERLFHISEILNSSIPELLGIGKEVFQQTNNESATGYQQKIENFYQENKEIYEKLLQSKDEQIMLLKSFLNDHRHN